MGVGDGVGDGDGDGAGVGDGVAFGVGVGDGVGDPGTGVGVGLGDPEAVGPDVAGEDDPDVLFVIPQPASSNNAQVMPDKMETLKLSRKERFIVFLQGELEGYGRTYSGCIRLTPICWRKDP